MDFIGSIGFIELYSIHVVCVVSCPRNLSTLKEVTIAKFRLGNQDLNCITQQVPSYGSSVLCVIIELCPNRNLLPIGSLLK